MSNEKFRPYLTGPELQLILAALKSQPSPPVGLIRYLETFAIKIERGVIAPAVTLQPTIEQKLGLIPEPAMPADSIQVLVTNYEMFPSERTKLSPRQLEAIQQYRFANDRMSEQEECDYVSSLPKT